MMRGASGLFIGAVCASIFVSDVLAADATPTKSAPSSSTPVTNPVPFDSSKPIAVNADNFYADLNKEIGTYDGNVVVVQGAIKMHADKVLVHAPKGKATNMEATGHVVVESPNGTATGDTGAYDVIARVIRLDGNVVLTKEQNVMKGAALEVKVATGEARLLGAPVNSGSKGRVQGLFVPSKTGNP